MVVLATFDRVLAPALLSPGHVPPGAGVVPGPSSSSGGAATAAAGQPHSNFTLLDDGDEEGEDLSLATRRGPTPPAAAAAAAGPATKGKWTEEVNVALTLSVH